MIPDRKFRHAAAALVERNFVALIWWLDGDEKTCRQADGNWKYYGNWIEPSDPIAVTLEEVYQIAIKLETMTEPKPESSELHTSYHLRKIKIEGVYGQISKVYEELDEYEEAMEQGNRIMALLELSDVFGALEAVVISHGFNMQDITRMSSATKRAFGSGHRKSKNEPSD